MRSYTTINIATNTTIEAIKNRRALVIISTSIAILIMSIVQPSYSQEDASQFSNPAVGLTISTIEIHVPRRSKERYIRKTLGVSERDIYIEGTDFFIYDNLKDTNNFYQVNVFTDIIADKNAIRGKSVKITVQVIDKWTLIVLPTIGLEFSPVFGLIFSDSNFIGYGDSVSAEVSGASASNFGLSISYDLRKIGGSKINGKLSEDLSTDELIDTAYGSSPIVISDNDKVNAIVRKSQGLFNVSQIQSNMPLDENLSIITDMGAYYFDSDYTVSAGIEITDNAFESMWFIPFTLGFSYEMNNFIFGSRYTIVPISSPNVALSNNIFSEARYSFQLPESIDKNGRNRFEIILNGLYGNTPLLMHNTPGTDETTQSISGVVRSNKFVSGATSHAIKIIDGEDMLLHTQYGVDASYYEVTGYADISDPAFSSGIFIGTGLSWKRLSAQLINVKLKYNFVVQYMSLEVGILVQ